MSPIKAIIADVDGVMVGKQEGVNFPLPHQDVIRALKRLSASGVPIVLCTAKFGHAIKDIAVQANLNNPHITDGGALIIDWLDDKVVAQHNIDRATARDYVQACLDNDIYVELYTAEDYYIQGSQHSEFTLKRSKVLQMEPQLVDSLIKIADQHDTIKLISFSEGDADKTKLEDNARQFGDKIHYIWSSHPYLDPRKPIVITAPAVSKKQAAIDVAASLGVPQGSVLGIGDSEADWGFMQLCGYVATIGEDSRRLQELARSKGEGRYKISASVDDHGLLEALEYFGLV